MSERFNDLPVGVRVEYVYTLWSKWLRRWLYKRGYVLCHADRYRKVNEAWHRNNLQDRHESDLRHQLYEANDRIRELEAEVEGHKRVEASLAERLTNAKLDF